MNFDFISPTKIYFGENKVKELHNILKEREFHKILFHYGSGSIKKTGLYDIVINELNLSNIPYIELGGVEANPDIELVRQGVKLCKVEQVDFILAVGGGSVIDSAKAIACGSLVDFDPWLFSIHQEKVTKCLPVGVILTISAAGSELSNSCVISNRKELIKNGFNSDLIRPAFAIEDPTLTYTVSNYQTMCGVVDILMHTFERYLTDNQPNKISDGFATSLIKEVIKAGSVLKEDPTNYDARATIMLASSFSHNGLTGLGGKMYFTVHKLEHVLSGMYPQIAHGAGLAVLFPAWAKYTYKYLFDRFYSFSVDALSENCEIEAELAINLAIENLKNYFRYLGMPTKLSDFGIDIDLNQMALNLTKNKTVKVAGFKELDYDDLINIFRLCE